MIITKIQRFRGKKPRYNVYLDDSRILELSDWTIGKFGLRLGDNIDDESIAKVVAIETETQAKNSAINYISYRRRSTREILNHLIKKGFDRKSALIAIRDLQSIGMIDDLEFARLFIRDRLKRKPIGQTLLRQQLLAKGITSEIADKLLTEFISPQSQQVAALELAKRKIRLARHSISKLDVEKQKKRLLDFLLRRGFSYEITMKTIHTTLG